MQISADRERLRGHLVSFLWDQWAQLGVLGATSRRDNWVVDPEALLLLSFEVGREEPRLFGEVLDWMVKNERLLSVQRLRNLIRDDADRALVEAAVGWLNGQGRRTRLEAQASARDTGKPPESFFRNSELPVDDPDPAFLAQGFLKPHSEPSRKSRAPDVLLPINLAFRLRLLLGIGARAEAVRVLVTTDAPQLSVQAIAASAAYTKRNVQDALGSLRAAGTLASTELGNEQLFSAPKKRWAAFLEIDRVPNHRHWPQLFGGFRTLLRFLADPANEGLSDYLLASKTRTISEELLPDLSFAGVPLARSEPDLTEIWTNALDALAR